MAFIFSGSTSDQVWSEAENAIRSSHILQDSRNGLTRELLHVHYEISNPIQRWVHSRNPAINPSFAIAEIIWILSGRNDAKFINFWNPALPKYAGNGDVYHGAYGHRIRNNFGFDQLYNAYHALKNNNLSRQIVIQLWDPKIDFPDESGEPRSADIPCNICSILKLRNGKLDWLQVMRSNDHYRGTPYNFVQFTTLQEILAGWLNCAVGSYNQISDSAHIYKDDENYFSAHANTENPINSDSLRFSREDFESILPKLVAITETLSGDRLTNSSIRSIMTKNTLPKEYMNWVYILGADSARRRQWHDEKYWIADLCSNEAIRHLWYRWDTKTSAP